MKLPFTLPKLPMAKILRGIVIADFVRKHGRPPLSATEIDEHHDAWMLENGAAVSKWARSTLKNLPTNVAQVMKTAKKIVASRKVEHPDDPLDPHGLGPEDIKK